MKTHKCQIFFKWSPPTTTTTTTTTKHSRGIAVKKIKEWEQRFKDPNPINNID